MRRIALTVAFTDETGATRQETKTIESSYAAMLADEHRLVHIVEAELKVAVGEQAKPKHNATTLKWLEFPNKPSPIQDYFDVQNSQAMWTELAHLVMGAEADLILAEGFKSLEPAQEPSFEDEAAINDLYYLHDRKMNLLNQAVYALIKVQDMIYRLLHESLGGDLVDSSKPDWEESQLRRTTILKGLEAKRASGELAQADFDIITRALDIPKSAPKADIARTYRNRLTHHIRPSVDYSMFFSDLQSREGEEIKNAQGKVIGRVHHVLARPKVQYEFAELHAAFSAYLDAVVLMLGDLSQLAILRR
ncbi:MAG: hypothetical protein WCF26_10535 [Candidatus Sulfotelmatobacter sp.]